MEPEVIGEHVQLAALQSTGGGVLVEGNDVRVVDVRVFCSFFSAFKITLNPTCQEEKIEKKLIVVKLFDRFQIEIKFFY